MSNNRIIEILCLFIKNKSYIKTKQTKKSIKLECEFGNYFFNLYNYGKIVLKL